MASTLLPACDADNHALAIPCLGAYGYELDEVAHVRAFFGVLANRASSPQVAGDRARAFDR
jgi:hypothetical protein